MTEKRCKHCGKVIILDFEEYLKKYPNEKKIMCPYCWITEDMI